MKFKIDIHEAAVFVHPLKARGQFGPHLLNIAAICFAHEHPSNASVSDDWIQVYLVFGVSFEPLEYRICGKNKLL